VKQPVVYGSLARIPERIEAIARVPSKGLPGSTEAIQREKRLKSWNREWKIRLIEQMNPEWKDLSSQAF
jgi:predicted GIY-YIG superfamily endonuclease